MQGTGKACGVLDSMKKNEKQNKPEMGVHTIGHPSLVKKNLIFSLALETGDLKLVKACSSSAQTFAQFYDRSSL